MTKVSTKNKSSHSRKGDVGRSFMGVPMTELRPHIEAHEAMMNDLENATVEEKIESIKNHLAIIPMLIEENHAKALEACKLGIVEILASI